MHEPLITSVSERSEFDRLGKPMPMIEVKFMVGDHGPFSLRFDKAGFDAQKALQEVVNFARRLEPLTGR